MVGISNNTHTRRQTTRLVIIAEACTRASLLLALWAFGLLRTLRSLGYLFRSPSEHEHRRPLISITKVFIVSYCVVLRLFVPAPHHLPFYLFLFNFGFARFYFLSEEGNPIAGLGPSVEVRA